MTNKPILLVDFDGVIHAYVSPWEGPEVVPDDPVPGAFAWLRRASSVFDVQIYSSRSQSPAGVAAMKKWMQKHNGPWNLVQFPREKPPAFLTIDDRCIQFNGNWDELDPEELRKFQPWHKRAIDPRLEAEQTRVNPGLRG